MSIKFILRIQTPGQIVFESEVEQALVSTGAGQITVLANHIPITSDMEIGIVTCFTAGLKPVKILVNGGVLNFEDNVLHILSVDAQIVDKKIKDSEFFPAMVEAKNNKIQEEIEKALQAGGYYQPDLSTVYLLAEERQAKYALLRELLED